MCDPNINHCRWWWWRHWWRDLKRKDGTFVLLTCHYCWFMLCYCYWRAVITVIITDRYSDDVDVVIDWMLLLKPNPSMMMGILGGGTSPFYTFPILTTSTLFVRPLLITDTLPRAYYSNLFRRIEAPPYYILIISAYYDLGIRSSIVRHGQPLCWMTQTACYGIVITYYSDSIYSRWYNEPTAWRWRIPWLSCGDLWYNDNYWEKEAHYLTSPLTPILREGYSNSRLFSPDDWYRDIVYSIILDSVIRWPWPCEW